MSQFRHFSSTSRRLLKKKAGEIFRTLPKVPTTQFLEPRELTRDILFSGYRPIIYPVRENPLFKEAGLRERRRAQQAGGEQNKTSAQEPVPNSMAGPRGTGGVSSGGVNGTWRYNPRIPSKLLPYNLWSATSMAMEYHPEWLGVPRAVVSKLRPFDTPAAAATLNAPQRTSGSLGDALANKQKAQIRKRRTSERFSDKKLAKEVEQFTRYLREKDGN